MARKKSWEISPHLDDLMMVLMKFVSEFEFHCASA